MDHTHENTIDRLNKRFAAYADLADTIDNDLLQEKIDVPKHKSLAEHLWCVVGARESYARAIENGAWAGFACSMDGFDAVDFQNKLATSATAVNASVAGVSSWTPERAELLTTLAEHEVMHEGQVIRHMYALGKTLPESWVWA